MHCLVTMLDVISTLEKDLPDFCKVKHTPTFLHAILSDIYPREMKTYVQKKKNLLVTECSFIA